MLGKQAPLSRSESLARSSLEEIYRAAVRAVEPAILLRKTLRISGSRLLVETPKVKHRLPLNGRVYVIGAGKGVDLTAGVWEGILGGRLEEGILVVRDRAYRGHPERLSILVGGHPLPDKRSVDGTEKCLRLLSRAAHNDWVIFFLLGGASSLLIQPPPGLTLDDKRAVTEMLLKSGMDIREMNCVRKHISAIKAGGVLRRAYPARVLTLAISDVLGDDPTVIGSAPSFYDPATYRDAWNVLKRHDLLKAIPHNARQYLLRGLRGEIPETMKPGNPLLRQSPYVLLANNRDALLGAKDRAESLGFSATILTSELKGDTHTRAKELCAFLGRVKQDDGYRRPHCFLLGGETTVRVRGKGLGGRNQEFALVAALELAGFPGLFLLSAGSDGSDGPTDAAGAFADGRTISRARTLGIDPYRALRDNDSYHFFESLGDLFCPGPTGTNVLDFKIVLMY